MKLLIQLHCFQRFRQFLSFKVSRSTVQHSASRVQRSASIVQGAASRVQRPASRIQSPASRVQNVASRVQCSESRVQSSASRVQRAESSVQSLACRVQLPASRAQRSESSVQLLRPESRNSGMSFFHIIFFFLSLVQSSNQICLIRQPYFSFPVLASDLNHEKLPLGLLNKYYLQITLSLKCSENFRGY